MADPTRQKIISIKIALANIGEYVTIKNLTRGGQLIQPVKGIDRNTIFNPAPNLQWLEGDIIQAEIHGRVNGYTRSVLSSGGTPIIINASVDTATPGVSL